MATPRHDKQPSVSTSTQNAEDIFKNSFTILHGYLKKRSPPKMFNIRRWQDRYFVLEKTKLVYYKTEKMYTQGERPQGVIHVQDIRGVSLPSDDREGCRFDLEISSQGRRIFELMASTDVECQKWCSLLSLLCHNVPHDEDDDGDSDIDDITTSSTQNGNDKKNTKNRRESDDGSDIEEEATKGPLIPPHKLIQAPAEVIREMDQFSLSVTLDLFGPGADKIATRVVLFTPITNTSTSNSSPLAVALKQATASSPLTLPVPSPTSTSSPTNASRSTLTHQSSLDHNGTIEGILNDPQLAAELLEFCKKIFCEEYCLFYWALQKYKACPDGSESQKIAARNLYDTYVKNGAEFEINTQATTREAIHAAIESGNLHKNTFESLYRHVMSLMRVDFLPKYLSSFKPENGTSTTTHQQSSLTTPATPTRKTSNERGRTLTYNNINSAVLKGWEEASRTDIVSRPNGAKRAYADWFDGDDSERRFFSVLLLANVDLHKSDHCLPRIRFLNRGGVFDGNVDRASRRKRMEQIEMERRLNGNAGTFTLPADADEWLDDGLDAVIAGPDIRLLRFIVYRVNDAAEEDISTHVMMGAVQVSLKDILCGDNGEIKQNINFAQSHSELTGYMRIMFQQRRRVRVSNNSRYLHRSYVFRDIHDRDLICHETLQESPFTFSMPHASLRRACLEFRRKRRMLLSEIRRIQKDVQKSKYPLEEEMAKKALVAYLQKRSKLYASVIVRWEKLVKLYDNYDGCYKALRFKPSRDKSDQPLNFVPINLHVQNFQVTHTGRSRCRREKATSSAPTPVISSTQQQQQQQQAQQSQLSPLSPTTPSHRTVSPHPRSGASTPVATPISSETHGTAPTPLILPSAAPIPRARRGKEIENKSHHRKIKGDLAPSEEMLEEIEHVQEKILTKYGRHVVKREKHEDVTSEIGSLDLRRYSEEDGLETLETIPPPDSPPPEAPTSPDQTPSINANIGSPTSPLHLPSPSPRARLTKPEDKISPRLALTTSSTNFNRGKSLNATANLGAMLAAERQASTIRLNLGGSKRAGSMSTPSKKEEQMELARQRDKARAEEREREQKERERSMMSDDSSAVERPRYKRKRERKADDTSYETVAYTTTTVGAFVQHAGGLKSGGMTKFLVQLKALQQKRSSEKLKTIMDEFSSSTSKKMYKMAAIAQQRQEVLFSQAITAITTTFVADLMTHIYEPDHLKRMAAAGFLCQIESLLSTFSGEQHMLSDFWFAVKSLEKVKFAIAEQKTPPNNHLASPTSSFSSSSSSSRSTSNGHSSHPSHSGHHINETFQRDMDSITIQLTTRSPFLHQIQQTSQNISIPIMKSGRGLELFRSNKSICDPHKRIVSINQYTPINPIVVVVLLPSHLYALIPSELKPNPRHTSWEIAVQSVQLQTPPTPSSQPSLQRATTTPTINVNAAIKPLPNLASTPAAKMTRFGDETPPPPPPMTDRTISDDDDSSSEEDEDEVQITNASQDGKRFDGEDDDAVPPPPSEPVPEDLSDSSTDYEEDDLEAELDGTTPSIDTKSLEKSKKPSHPKDVESDELEILSPLIQVFPVMITQGINEMQSVANKMGRHQLQQEINKYGIQQLKAYYKDFVRFAMAEKNRGGNKSYADPEYLAGILEDITAIEAMIGNTAGEKNVLLLQLAGDVSRRMLGGRVVCCKSAKDRTSMSVTWEQARIMYEEHGLMDSELQTAMNLMRLEGVRRANVLKNTGHTAYAFNLLQRSLLPQVFRPPEMACSASTQS